MLENIRNVNLVRVAMFVPDRVMAFADYLRAGQNEGGSYGDMVTRLQESREMDMRGTEITLGKVVGAIGFVVRHPREALRDTLEVYIGDNDIHMERLREEKWD